MLRGNGAIVIFFKIVHNGSFCGLHQVDLILAATSIDHAKNLMLLAKPMIILQIV